MWDAISKKIKSKIFKLFSYLLVSQILYSACSFLMGIITSRFYGPLIMGGYNYALSFTTIFSPLLLFGLESIVTKDLAQLNNKNEVLGSAIVVFIIGQTMAIVMCILTMVVTGMDRLKSVISLFFVIPWIFSCLSGFKFYLISQSNLRNYTIIWSVQTVIFFAIKALLAVKNVSIVWFAAVYSLELSLTYIMMSVSYLNIKNIEKPKIDKNRVLKYLRLGFPLMLSSVASTIYMKIDQVMVGNMIGDEDLGIYSIAVSLSEFWYILPTAIYTSTLPAIAVLYEQDYRNFKNRLQKQADVFAIVGYLALLFIPLAGRVFVPIIYGQAYKYAGQLMAVYVLAGFCVCIGYVSSTFISIREKTVYSMCITVVGCISNIILNYYMIPIYGSMGAVYATVITQFITGLLINSIVGLWKTEIKDISLIQYKSLFPFVRVVNYLKKN